MYGIDFDDGDPRPAPPSPPDDVGALYSDLSVAAGIWSGHATADRCPTFSRGDARHFADLFQRAATLAKQGGA